MQITKPSVCRERWYTRHNHTFLRGPAALCVRPNVFGTGEDQPTLIDTPQQTRGARCIRRGCTSAFTFQIDGQRGRTTPAQNSLNKTAFAQHRCAFEYHGGFKSVVVSAAVPRDRRQMCALPQNSLVMFMRALGEGTARFANINLLAINAPASIDDTRQLNVLVFGAAQEQRAQIERARRHVE